MTNGVPQRITDVINWWLQEEIVNSDAGLNAYLSDFDDRRADLYKRHGDPTNFLASKAISHDNRFRFFAENYGNVDSWLDDRGASKFIFAALMAVSGGYRKQCIIEAVSAKDYMHRRHDLGPTGIDVASVVTSELRQGLDSHTSNEIVARAVTRTLQAKDRIIELDQFLFEGAVDLNSSALVVLTQETQRIGVSMAAAHIASVATLRGGDYEKIPFLEPKTITEAGIIYPFAQ